MSIRPLHLALIFVGGFVGTVLRAVVGFGVTSGFAELGGELVAAWGPRLELSLPGAAALLLVNLLGACAFGVMAQRLLRAHDQARAIRVRLFVGTGVLGGFTTYSALAELLFFMVNGGEWGWGLAYGGVTLVGGVLATACGMWIGDRLGRGERGATVTAGGPA